LSRPSAVAIVTGTELVRGDRNDRNGPFYMREAHALGLRPTRVIVVGDEEHELEAALREGLDADLCLVSGGLGPTHDDRTVEIVARVTGRALVVDADLERQIEEVSRTAAERLGRPYADFAPGVTKQATVPEGAHVLGLAGTAPGLALEDQGRAVVILPGPPGELQRLWPRAVESRPVQRVLARAVAPSRRVLRLYGLSESAVARALREAGGDGDGVEATICARDFEIHVDLVAEPGAEERADALARRLREPLEEHLFAADEQTIQELVLGLCRTRRLTLGVAESCTGGLVAARLTAVPGASDVFLGGVVAYAESVKLGELDVPQEVLARHGAVSAETARAMALGARSRLGVDVAVSVTGVAGPGGGTPEKPVGLVFFHASGPDGDEALRFELPGDRDWIRARSAVAALHLVRRLLTRSRHKDA
jgi:competence/damage-inducible protein CinA-like protein